MANLLIERLKSLNKPRVVFWHRSLRFEGIVVSCDDEFLELYDDKREYRKFLKVSEIEDLEVKD